jgi:hypothetical protein
VAGPVRPPRCPQAAGYGRDALPIRSTSTSRCWATSTRSCRRARTCRWPSAGSDEAGTANGRVPAADRDAFRSVLVNLVSAAVARLDTAPDPAAHAEAVADHLLPDVLPYRLGTPALFSFATFNGRPLAANAPEVMFSLVLGAAVPTGLRMAQAAETRSDDFPYVVPHTG